MVSDCPSCGRRSTKAVAAAVATAVLVLLLLEIELAVGICMLRCFSNPGTWRYQDLAFWWRPDASLERAPPTSDALRDELERTPELQAVVLNLDRSPERWERTRSAFVAAGIPVSRFTALDGATIPAGLTAAELAVIPAYTIDPRTAGKCSGCHSLNSIACAVSHYRMVAAGAGLPQPRVLAEDDVNLFEGARQELREAAATMALVDPEWDILYFPTSYTYSAPSAVKVDASFCCDAVTGGWDHAAWGRMKTGERLYMVSPRGAVRMPEWKRQIGLHQANDWSTIAGVVNGTMWPHTPLRIYRWNKLICSNAKVQSTRASSAVMTWHYKIREWMPWT